MPALVVRAAGADRLRARAERGDRDLDVTRNRRAPPAVVDCEAHAVVHHPGAPVTGAASRGKTETRRSTCARSDRAALDQFARHGGDVLHVQIEDRACELSTSTNRLMCVPLNCAAGPR